MNHLRNSFVSFAWATLFSLVSAGLLIESASALPAFAIREKVSCVMCHTGGSAPHLTHYGYLYRRAGFRPPGNIGNQESDDNAMTFQDHMAAGVNFSYEYVANTPVGAPKATRLSNNFNVPEVEVWPLVGAFRGNYGVWSELDATPTTSGGGGVSLSQADLRFAKGTADLFFNFRGGIIAPEGFGASDQWFDDANIPLFDRLSAHANQDTLALPFGAMETPQVGAELGLNYQDSHLTLGIYNGFTGINSDGTAGTDLTPALMNRNSGLAKDYKIQLDQFIGEIGAVTAAYYNGVIPLMDPTGTAFNWLDHYDMERLYLTWFVIPATFDVLTGGGLAKNEQVSVSATPDGTFNSQGAFLGGIWYALPHLNLSARYDWNAFNTSGALRAMARGYSLQASLPYENNLYVIRVNHATSDLASGDTLAGTTNDFRAEWRFLF